MKKLFTLFLLAGVLAFASSCNDNDDEWLAVSGQGSFTVDNCTSYWLYRMVVESTDTSVTTYLLGGTNTVDSDAKFRGRGAAVIFSYDTTEAEILTAQNLTISDSGATASYTTYVNYSSDDSDRAFTDILSGTIVVTKLGGFYTIRLLGADADGNDISVGYSGYTFAYIYDSDAE